MNAIKNRIRSRKGASITFALLIFLVCAVISGVVIVAATVSSGRLDRIAETDQRYYAVTSAAELLKDALDGKTVIVETVETSMVTKASDGTEKPDTRTYAKASNMYFDAEKSTSTKLEDAMSVANLSVLGDAAFVVADAAFEHMPGVEMSAVTDHVIDGVKTSTPRDLTLTANTGDSDANSALAVDVREEAASNGILTFYIKQADARDASKAYTLKMSFKADVRTNVDMQTTVGAPTNVANGGTVLTYETVETTKRTTETTMRWTLTGITKSVWPEEVGP